MAYRVERNGPDLRIVFPPRLAWPARILYYGIFGFALGSFCFFLPRGEAVPPAVILPALAVLGPFLYFATFRETLLATPDSLRLKRSALGMFSWGREYRFEDVLCFCARDERESFSIGGALDRGAGIIFLLSDGRTYRLFLGHGFRRLAFEALGVTRWTGPGLTAAEAVLIAKLVNLWMESRARISGSPDKRRNNKAS